MSFLSFNSKVCTLSPNWKHLFTTLVLIIYLISLSSDFWCLFKCLFFLITLFYNVKERKREIKRTFVNASTLLYDFLCYRLTHTQVGRTRDFSCWRIFTDIHRNPNTLMLAILIASAEFNLLFIFNSTRFKIDGEQSMLLISGHMWRNLPIGL